MIGTPLTEFVITTSSVCVILTLAVMFCCLYIKLSDMWMARRQNLPWENLNTRPSLYNNERRYTRPEAENCTIFVADVALHGCTEQVPQCELERSLKVVEKAAMDAATHHA